MIPAGISFAICPIAGGIAFMYFSSIWQDQLLKSLIVSFIIAYFPTFFITWSYSKGDGLLWPYFQKLAFWKYFVDTFLKGSSVNIEDPLDHKKNYIFCSFPHGSASANHILTMTDSREFLSKIHPGPRRDLCASVLFLIPFFKELLLLLGCIDASSKTARHNLKKNRSILIFVGGEKEQLMTEYGVQQIYLKNRKGFIKLAIEYGVDLVPMYAFGENEVYTTHHFFPEIQKWLQRNLQLGITIFTGRFGTLIPYQRPIFVEIGKPIKVVKKDAKLISIEDIDKLHETFVNEIKRLFDRTKVKYPEYSKSELIIH